ncbi:MAG: asparagine synthase (glutamine-hydrolyzing) [Gemmatimonadales bacterium]|jgi:asparagine synthase (glutamine-hydrolysing)|nr:asparagine synthase (glutamine-hydrolyzing) [Gemmatimonadales bacterium]MBT6376091.1 asparagine synthase (glutamine-hydrolyzing) [Gemmatimonadales bacterium]MBT6694898.1 asparagine synthase (glutamine-hydrolyzing) [Gemmatimonadales bacterium]MBT7501860.1 asparagine synthase (glutamine-hydrolyzing) [Gemmatimonadales bacterium]
MCGIAGVVALTEDRRPVDPKAVTRMSERLSHRGPDGVRGFVSRSGACALGHARLAVIDLHTGDQPMTVADESVHVVCNGEIYNFRALRRELEEKGHRFRTASDTEVLLHGYRAWGDALPERLDGMFAFAIWDSANERMLLARDRAGKKPLFWTTDGSRFAFASEIKALTGLDWATDDIDADALPFYLSFGYVPGPKTFYRGITALAPAHRMVIEGGRVSEPERYWELSWGTSPMVAGVDVLAKETRTLLRNAVERRLVADVPLGAFLSGGIDSTIIVGLMRELTEGPIQTFSLGFADDPTYDETAFARGTAERFGTDHTEFMLGAGEISRVADLVAAHDQPFGDSSAIPTHIVSELTREHVTVALTGDGGDEMFAGYPRFLAMQLAERIPRPLAQMGRTLSGLLPYHSNFRHPTRRAKQFFDAAALGPEERMLSWLGFFQDQLGDMLVPGTASVPDRESLLRSYSVPWNAHPGASVLSKTLALNFATYLPEDLLVKADRCSMAHGLELRSPFLDTAVMEFASGLPDRVRIRGKKQTGLKWLLRHAFADLIPAEITNRKKMGFGVPLPTWFRTHWKTRYEDEVLGPDARIRQWLRPEPVEALWKSHQSGRVDHSHRLWALFTLETWLRSR